VVLAEWSPKNSPTLLLRKTVTWTVVVLGWLVGLTAFGAGVTPQLIVNVVESLPNLGTAIVLVLLGVAARALSLARGVISAVNMQIHSARLLSLAVKWLVLVFAAAHGAGPSARGWRDRCVWACHSLRRNRAGRGARHRAGLQGNRQSILERQ